MSRQASQQTKDIREAIKLGMTNKVIAELLNCTTAQVARVRHRDSARVKAKQRAKQREYNRRHRAKKKAQAAAVVELTDHEINALRDVPNQPMPVTMEGPVKYTWAERIRIFFRGW